MFGEDDTKGSPKRSGETNIKLGLIVGQATDMEAACSQDWACVGSRASSGGETAERVKSGWLAWTKKQKEDKRIRSPRAVPTQRGSNDALLITHSFSRNFCFNVLSLGPCSDVRHSFQGQPLKRGPNVDQVLEEPSRPSVACCWIGHWRRRLVAPFQFHISTASAPDSNVCDGVFRACLNKWLLTQIKKKHYLYE